MLDKMPNLNTYKAMQNTENSGQVQEDRFSIAVYRKEAVVNITFTTISDYSAIELYDYIIQSVQRGSLRLDLKTS